MSDVSTKPEALVRLVFFLRGERVMLDADLALLYGVTTGALNRAVKRNMERFPSDFMFRLSSEDWEDLKCQIGISRTAPGSGRGGPHSRIDTTASHGGRRGLPHAFTEQGVAMLSSVLRSRRAVGVNIAIMRTFVQLRRLMDSNRELARKIEAMEKRYDEKFAVVFNAIKQLIAAESTRKAQPRRKIGFGR
jgi:hypothetical protein